MNFWDSILPRLNLIFPILLASFFLIRTRKRIGLILLTVSLVVFLPREYLLYGRLGIGSIFLGLFTVLIFFTSDHLEFKIFFFQIYFFVSYIFVSGVRIFAEGPEYMMYLLDSVPYFPVIIFSREIFDTSRIKTSNPIISILISFTLLYPLLLLINSFILPHLPAEDISEIAFYTVVVTVVLTVAFSLLKPLMRIFTPLYMETGKYLIKYLSNLPDLHTINDLALYTEEFLKTHFPIAEIAFISEAEGGLRMEFKEKRGRPLFHEEAEFLSIISRELNSRSRNLYYLQELENKLDEIRSLEDELGRIKVYSLLGHMIATVTHQLRNPIAVMRNSSELLLSGELSSSEQAEVFITVDEEARHLDEIVNKFLEFAKTREFAMEKTPIRPLIKQLMEKKRFSDANIIVKGKNMELNTNAAALEEVLAIILRNALEAIDGNGGRVEIRLDTNSIVVADNGTPLELSRDQLFQPFVTTKAKGVGLGLSIVKKFSELLQMQITFQQKRKWKYFTMRWNSEE